MRIDLSRAIYKELNNGRFINKQEFRNGQLISNPLFDELAGESRREEYRLMYERIGYSLKMMGDSFYMNEIDHNNDDAELSVAAAKIQTVIVILLRGITQEHLPSTLITNSGFGLSRAYIDKFVENEEFAAILRAVDIKDLHKEIENTLIDRKIAYWNDLDNLVLSDSGVGLLEHMLLNINDSEHN